MTRAVPTLSIVVRPKLSFGRLLGWLKENGFDCELSGADRPLRGCLAARCGYGLAFIDSSDTEDEQRFSLAHELAHFLRNHWSVRRRVCKRLGPDALEVLDGEREPTEQERMQALLRGIPLGLHLHLMERDKDGNPTNATIAEAEDDADRLAYELLAPAEHVLAQGAAAGKPALVQRLRQYYGLPAVQASRYAGILVPTVHADPLLRRLRALR
jgi:hypothetical protein